MRKFLLLLLFGISFQVYSQNLAPIAINDTVFYSYAYIHENDSIKIDLFFLQNDTDPNGNTITADENQDTRYNPCGCAFFS